MKTIKLTKEETLRLTSLCVQKLVFYKSKSFIKPIGKDLNDIQTEDKLRLRAILNKLN